MTELIVHKYLTTPCTSSWSWCGEFLQVNPLQYPQVVLHSSLCRLHEHRVLLQSDLQLHRMVLRGSFGAGSKSVRFGCKRTLECSQPQSSGGSSLSWIQVCKDKAVFLFWLKFEIQRKDMFYLKKIIRIQKLRV